MTPNQSGQQNSPNEPWDDEDEISLLDLALTIAQNLKLLVFGSLGAGILALVIAVIWPNIYTGKASILPPDQSNALSAGGLLAGALGGLGGVAGDLAGLKDPGQRYIAYLKSDEFRNIIIKKYDLQKYYDKDTLFYTRKKLDRNVDISSDKQSGLITIEVDGYDAKFAAELANGFVTELRIFTGKLDLQEAQNRRIFLEEQIKDISSRTFQDPYSQQQIISGLIQQLEMAKVDEGRVGPTFTQIDFASTPEIKSKPKRALIAILTTLATGFLLLIFVFVRQALRNAEADPEAKDKMAQIKSLFKAFWGTVKNWRKWRLR
ncbi:Wzz/FepE/Etk N-terminal domain-containing protein [Polynucleobacter sp. MG-28-Ekke-A2]|uniref:Wzz/FepE/Etk N-terminal domain-containing protein n=1 Tax=Polynucleobacter sp. MG-28-Ekke-A2 TaxID=3108276 RepID=UPI002B234EE7|nr:Wzz/FepE/Etk N-terminal domain-containing protein [Polynucleobacter sp. MG-28-Ekke-A2]MEA9601191.1 Wzz/FepE/Etk N-terminal domain-containing protein [Polynucleobacter sp. MG-28-Ekke-A2]